MTRGDEFKLLLSEAMISLRRLGQGPYSRADVVAVLAPLGSHLEYFLRVAVHPNSSRRDGLQSLIDGLSATGLPKLQISALHELRIVYNNAKHAPSSVLPLGEVLGFVERAAEAVSDLIALAPGIVAIPAERKLSYHLYVAFWDHVTEGETEITVDLPSGHWTHSDNIDSFSLDWRSWDDLKAVLVRHPRFRLGRDGFAADVWDSLEASSSFLDAGIWDGDYGELIRLLGSFHDHVLSSKVLDGLGRATSLASASKALILSAIDVARAAPTRLSIVDLVSAMVARARTEYALPSADTTWPVANQIANLVEGVSFSRWRYLIGPVIRRRSSSIAHADPTVIALDGEIIVYWLP